MKDLIFKLSARVQSLMVQEEGQDLVEYALITAVISFGLVTTLNVLSNDINSVFANIGTRLTAAA